jgi:hypothetical protein
MQCNATTLANSFPSVPLSLSLSLTNPSPLNTHTFSSVFLTGEERTTVPMHDTAETTTTPTTTEAVQEPG